MATCAGWGIVKGMDNLPTVEHVESLFHGRFGQKFFCASLRVLLFDRTEDEGGGRRVFLTESL